jgi:hypothetical protein
LEKRTEQVLPGSERDLGRLEGQEAEGRNDPMYEHMNK